jgi:alkylation response protein AidB-like acyl-CoA dehydrogenase
LPLAWWLFGFNGGYGGSLLWEEFGKGGQSAVAVVVLLVIFTGASVMLGIIPGFVLGWVLSAVPRALSHKASQAARDLP